MQQQWSAVDNYLIKALIPTCDPVLDRVLETHNHRPGSPAHDVAANQGRFSPRWYAG